MTSALRKIFRFYGLIRPREGALHLTLSFGSASGTILHFQADQVIIESPPLSLEETPFDQVQASVSELAERFSLILCLLTRQPYHIDLTSWQQLDAETGTLLQPGMFRPPERAPGKLELVGVPIETLGVEKLVNDAALREALIDYRAALENRKDALVFLWRAVEGLHETIIRTVKSRKKDFSITEKRLGLTPDTLKGMQKKASNAKYRQRHTIGPRVLLSDQELEQYFIQARDVIVAYAGAL